MTTWVLNKRTKTVHATEDSHTLCGWWAGDMLPIDTPPDASRVCSECSAKLRKMNSKTPWMEPVLLHHSRSSFTSKITSKIRLSMALEAAQKGHWGRI